MMDFVPQLVGERRIVSKCPFSEETTTFEAWFVLSRLNERDRQFELKLKLENHHD
jgi:hypothetical protein